MARDKTVIRTTCPRDCYDSCGIAVVKRGGAITKVLGAIPTIRSLAAACVANAPSPTTESGAIPASGCSIP